MLCRTALCFKNNSFGKKGNRRTCEQDKKTAKNQNKDIDRWIFSIIPSNDGNFFTKSRNEVRIRHFSCHGTRNRRVTILATLDKQDRQICKEGRKKVYFGQNFKIIQFEYTFSISDQRKMIFENSFFSK